MSKYDKASLVHIPSGYKSGTLYNVLPNNADGDFDFSRASTATRVNKDGLIETVATGTPRLNYPLLDGVVQDNPVLLLEPSRTNLITYSEDFISSSWVKTGVSITSNVEISPDGSQNASKLIEDAFTGTKRLRINALSTSGDNTLSFFVKAAERKYVLLREAGQTGAFSYFDLENGVKGTSSLAENIQIQKFKNDWYRISFKDNLTSVAIELRLALSDGVNSYQGDGTSGVYIWGAQVEQGSYPTSYIPTSGSTVTRSADACNGAGTADDFNDSEGVLYANIAALDDAETNNRRLGLTKNNTFEGLRIQYDNSTIGAVLYDGSTNQYSRTFTFNDLSLFAKVAFKYKASDFAVWINGFEYGAQASGTTLTDGTLDDLSFDYVNGNFFRGKTKEVIVFKEALSDTDLETLTSYRSFNEMATELLFTIE